MSCRWAEKSFGNVGLGGMVRATLTIIERFCAIARGHLERRLLYRGRSAEVNESQWRMNSELVFSQQDAEGCLMARRERGGRRKCQAPRDL